MFFESATCSPWQKQANVAAALIGKCLGHLAGKLRVSCAADKAAYLERLAEQASQGNCKAAYATARKILGHKRKKPFAPEVLPDPLCHCCQVEAALLCS